MAVASHPSMDIPLKDVLSIPLETEISANQKVLKPSVLIELSDVVEDLQVCAMVVDWPLQKEGWCGASCGRVLHTLDQLCAQSNTLMSARRPICLWDGKRNSLSPEDNWGRAALYSKETNKTIHVASKEQYYEHHDTVVVDVWNDFSRGHWPELYQEQQQRDCLRWDEGKEPITAFDLSALLLRE
jgi:hypothetical protein